MTQLTAVALDQLKISIQDWAKALGFADIGVSNIDLRTHEKHLHAWIKRGFYGDMTYLVKHGLKRSRPEQLVPQTLRIISVRMDHLPPTKPPMQTLKRKN